MLSSLFDFLLYKMEIEIRIIVMQPSIVIEIDYPEIS